MAFVSKQTAVLVVCIKNLADVVKAPLLVVEIAAVGVRVPVVPATKMDFGVTPTEGAQ